ncbi:hypothetical protein HK103_007548 [Boothiomyces macroporosus]|uniref:Uncharacterized protein n=1 Tax=Boothiomyces macroporosus TaxID=261099 RepID=A0AAD5UFV6_9FUNG|nr:hypothetical protein HK103_007548 [Boothiomyces macroporosus]
MFGNSIDFCGVGCQTGFGLCQNDILSGNNQTSAPPQQSVVNSSPATGDSVTTTNSQDTRKVPGEQSLGTKFLVAGLILGGLLAFIGVLSSVLYISNQKRLESKRIAELNALKSSDDYSHNGSISQVAPLAYTPGTSASSTIAPPSSAVRPTYRQEYPPPPKDYTPSTVQPVYSPSSVVLSEDAQKILMKRGMFAEIERKETEYTSRADYAPSEN